MTPALQVLQCDLYWHPQHALVVLSSLQRQYRVTCSPRSGTRLIARLQQQGWHLQGITSKPDQRHWSCYRFHRQRATAQEEDHAAEEDQPAVPSNILPFPGRFFHLH